MDLQHFEEAVCLASFGQIWSGSPRLVTESSNIAVPVSGLGENFFGVTFRSVSAVGQLIDDFSVHGAHNLHPELRYGSNSLNDLASWIINPSDGNT